MEPPAKRLRLGQAPYDDDDDEDEALDELSMTATQFDAKQDPLYQLDKGRAKAATRLKSAWERIFEKYEKDFTGVGDEIDLATGEVIVNNGHLQSLDDEKDRAREGSVSSNEEERIMRGKEAGPVRDSHSKSLVRTNASSQSRLLGTQTRPDQVLVANGNHHQPPYLGIYPNMFNPADPFIFHNRPVDPLWQTPEISVPLYQDRFGFVSQAMGHPQPLEYQYGPMLMGERHGYDSTSSIIHRRPVPRRLSYREATGRDSMPRLASAVDDSDEDDILLGGSTQEPIKDTTTTPTKSSPLHTAISQANTVRQTDANHGIIITTEQISQKPGRRPGRPKKIVPAKQLESGEEATKKSDGNSETGLDIHISKSNSTVSLEATLMPSLSPSPVPVGKNSTPVKELVQAKGPTPTDTDPADSQKRRSSRSRKQIEFYSNVSWDKGRRSGIGTPSRTDDTENVANQVSNSPASEMDEHSLHVGSRRPSQGEHTQPESIGESNMVGIEEPSSSADIPDLDQQHDTELSIGGEVDTGNEQVENNRADPFSDGSSVTPDSLCMNSTANADQVEAPPVDNETNPHDEPALPDNLSDTEDLHISLEDSVQDSLSIELGESRPSSPNSAIRDTNVEADEEVPSTSLTGGEIPDDPAEICGFDVAERDNREGTQTRSVQIASQETTNELPTPIGEQEQERSVPTDAVEPALQSNNEAAHPTPPEQASPSIDLAEVAMSPPAQELTIPLRSGKRSPSKTSSLALQSSPVRDSVDSDSEPTNPPNVTQTPKSPEIQLPPPAKPTDASTPSTPKKRIKTYEAPSSRNSSYRTSAKKKFALASLVPDDPGDDDDDELSVLSSSAVSSSFLSILGRTKTIPHHPAIRSPASATPHKTGRRHGFLAGPAVTPHRVSKRKAPPATDSRASRRLGRTGFVSSSGVQSSPLARIVTSVDRSDDVVVSTPSRRAKVRDKDGGSGKGKNVDIPGSSPTRTPGGSVRKCGEDGFVCDRDFCFTCCR
ncbi:hypothetical protein F5Y04DRAFT_249246 [Hypomontagnella monticulosa]|nr:hypothetical protein F5Y04DRAFT_249246 [Hypomontagnella monticulosa]